MKLIFLVLWFPLMTDDFKALMFKIGKGKPKCLEVLCATNATSTNMEVNSGLHVEKLDNNRLSTDTHWLRGIRETSKLVRPITNIVLRIKNAALKCKSVTPFVEFTHQQMHYLI